MANQIIIEASNYKEVLSVLDEKHNFDGCGKWKKVSRGFVYVSELSHIRYGFAHNSKWQQWVITLDRHSEMQKT